MSDIPTKKELDDAYEKAVDIHVKYLERHHVKMPQKKSFKALWLSMLVHYKGEFVHKDRISDAVRREHPHAGHDQQVRHLKRDGWNITGSKGQHKLDPYIPSPSHTNDQLRRKGRLNARAFKDLKKTFGNSCASCGAKEGQYDTRYGDDRIVLQQGHIDPSKPSKELQNIIPQCQFCNRSYKDDFVFDSKGRVKSIASINPIKRSSESVQKKVLAWLKQKFSSD